MALDASSLSSSIKSLLEDIDFENGEIPNDQIITAVATAIISQITSNAEVVIPSGSSAGTYSVS